MKKLLSIACLVLAPMAQALDAPAALIPAGLAPGSQFYIIFATSTTTPGNLSVAGFNSFVNTAADLSSIKGTDNPTLTWQAWLAHDDGTVQTLSLFADTTRPIYNTNGDLLANNRADLLDGTLSTAIAYDEAGVSAGPTQVYTGADSLGNSMGVNDDTLGGTDAATDGCGYTSRTSATMGLGGLYGGVGCVGLAKMYAVSPLLTVPAGVGASASAFNWD